MTPNYPLVEPASIEEWRDWLAENSETSPPIRLVLKKKGSSHAGITYVEALEEALRFGWIDHTAGALDEFRWTVSFGKRRPGSTWAAGNKAAVERLEAEGRMTAPGRAVVERAKADGSWNALDEIDRLQVPADLAAALCQEEASLGWDSISESVRKQLLWSVASAKKPETRLKRIAIAVAAARAQVPNRL